MLLTDDYAHPVPRRARLKWRENWLFFLLDPERGVFVTAHLSLQPTAGVARYSCNLVIDGERISFADEIAHPDNLVQAKTLSLGRLEVQFTEPQGVFRVRFDGPAHQVDMRLEASLPMFDYAACADANPDEFSLSDSTSQGFGAFRHQNQAMRGTGSLRFSDGRPTRSLSGAGYRDHSWGMRDDNLTLRHTWAWMSFPDATLHVTLVKSQFRPELWVREGYWGTPKGNLTLKDCSVSFEGRSDDGLPARVRFDAIDALGGVIAVEADIEGAYARNRFMAGRPGARAYVMRHNFCRCLRVSDGREGIALVEIGASEDPVDSALSSGHMRHS